MQFEPVSVTNIMQEYNTMQFKAAAVAMYTNYQAGKACSSCYTCTVTSFHHHSPNMTATSIQDNNCGDHAY